MRPNTFRYLTRGEKAVIPPPILAGIDVEKIEIHNRRWTFLTPGNITVARGYRIFWPGAPDEARSLSYLAHLVHEVTHVWQYNHLAIGMYSLRWLDRRYGYHLESGASFFDFGLEQQASILEDSFLAANGKRPRRARNAPAPELYVKILAEIGAH